MKLNELQGLIEGEFLTACKEKSIKGVYCSDMLSRVMGNVKGQNVWITIQCHMNVIAVSSLLEIDCIVFAEDVAPSDEMIAKAESEGVVLLKTALSEYEISGRIYKALQGK